MDRASLELWQAERLRDAVTPMHGYLNKLRRRMEKVGFPHADPLFQFVVAAENAVHSLWVNLHYLTCDRRKGIGDVPSGPGSGGS